MQRASCTRPAPGPPRTCVLPPLHVAPELLAHARRHLLKQLLVAGLTLVVGVLDAAVRLGQPLVRGLTLCHHQLSLLELRGGEGRRRRHISLWCSLVLQHAWCQGSMGAQPSCPTCCCGPTAKHNTAQHILCTAQLQPTAHLRLQLRPAAACLSLHLLKLALHSGQLPAKHLPIHILGHVGLDGGRLLLRSQLAFLNVLRNQPRKLGPELLLQAVRQVQVQ